MINYIFATTHFCPIIILGGIHRDGSFQEMTCNFSSMPPWTLAKVTFNSEEQADINVTCKSTNVIISWYNSAIETNLIM